MLTNAPHGSIVEGRPGVIHAQNNLRHPDLFLLKLQPNQSPVDQATIATALDQESNVVGAFLRALFAGQPVTFTYCSPYSQQTKQYTVQPNGLLWDRDWWYLVGQRVDKNSERTQADLAGAVDPAPWLWRADRVLSMTTQPVPQHATTNQPTVNFDVNDLLGRTWLAGAMQTWRTEASVQLRLTAQQASLLRQDWYYRWADYTEQTDSRWLMTFGEDNPQIVFDLLRWLGPGAELITPQAWRQQLREELLSMAAIYTT